MALLNLVNARDAMRHGGPISIAGTSPQRGGAIVLKSEAGAGTTAELWLPVASAETDDPSIPVLIEETMPKLSQMRILVVDDDVLVLMNTAALLEHLGHVAADAESGAEALEMFAKEPFDLIITDQAMPNMTGTERRGHSPDPSWRSRHHRQRL